MAVSRIHCQQIVRKFFTYFDGQFSVGFLEIRIAGALGNSKDLVVVARFQIGSHAAAAVCLVGSVVVIVCLGENGSAVIGRAGAADFHVEY